MRYDEYRRFDATGLAELVARREVSAQELLDVAVERAEAVDGRLNAIVRPMHDLARDRAGGELAGPFAGVPFLIKDLLQDYAGLPTGSGSRAGRRNIPERHSEAVRRWLDAGLVVFGKTNTPEFGLKSITEPTVDGPARNPWNTDHTPGGSSGGSGAAVAAGIVPVAGGNDGGGSIRIPAACCHLFGLKPGRGLVPAGPAHGEYDQGLATDGVLSRTVRDTAAMLDVLTTSHDPGGPYLAARPEISYAELARRTPRRLRIGFTTASPIGTPVSPEAVAAVEDMVGLLTKLGHDVEPAEPGVDGKALAVDFMTAWYAGTAATVAELRRAGARDQDFETDTLLLAAVGRAMPAPQYHLAIQRRNVHSRALAAFHRTYDLLLTPTLAEPPVRIGALETPAVVKAAGQAVMRLGLIGGLARTSLWQQVVLANLSTVPFTQLANMTGRPAMSVPGHRTPDGLPLGVQFVGPLGGEDVLLSLATQLEAERPWADEEPPL
ncbi:amidase [Streptomyces sp. HUAS MG47]|uniref:amidase n=1 Tax=Streptomyces solicamelliae TaxID=3231716 RepID=UPI003877AC09